LRCAARPVYGEKAFFGIEVTGASRVREGDVAGLKAFLEDYPDAGAFLLYAGAEPYYEDKIHCVPSHGFLQGRGPTLFFTRDEERNLRGPPHWIGIHLSFPWSPTPSTDYRMITGYWSTPHMCG